MFFFKELWKNLASGAIATQSTSYFNWRAPKAIDGNPDADFLHNHCSYTFYSHNPWWKLSFNRPVLVKEVTIVNRGDCCGKLHYFVFSYTYDTFTYLVFRHYRQTVLRMFSLVKMIALTSPSSKTNRPGRSQQPYFAPCLYNPKYTL